MLVLRGLPAAIMALYGPSGRIQAAVTGLGILLQNNSSLVQALTTMGNTSDHARVRHACRSAAKMLSEGAEPLEAIRSAEMAVFPQYVRVIIAAPIPDTIKGRLLTDWQNREESNSELLGRFIFPMITFIMSIPLTMSLLMFVLPQFVEISRGLEIEFSPFISLVVKFFSFGDLAILTYIFAVVATSVGLVVLSLTLLKYLRGTSIDEIDLYRILAATEPEYRVKVLEVLAIPHILPKLHGKIRAFLMQVEQGATLQQALKVAKLDTFQQWFITLALNCETDGQLMSQAAEMVESRVETTFSITGDVITVLTIIIQGVIIGGTVYSCMRFILDIMAASFI